MGWTIREAAEKDLPQVVALLADDPLGEQREEVAQPLPACYIDAFRHIQQDKNSFLFVLCDGETVAGSLQITFTWHLSHKGSRRATIENVRVDSHRRGQGIGTRLMQYAIGFAGENRCSLVQLTTDKSRSDAHRFYRRLGFRDTHVGMKLKLEPSRWQGADAPRMQP